MSVQQPSATPGTRPRGVTDEKAASQYVREMFSRIAGRYDLLNHLLSFQMDRYWRGRVARRFRNIMNAREARILDLCCGTGDLALALARQGRSCIIGCDFSHPMLIRARKKLVQRGRLPLAAEADALQLPFADSTFDLVVCSFGFRNLANYRAGLNEIRRVLRPGGVVGILEFSEPGGWLRPFYSLYLHRVLPRVGEWVSGVSGSYSYLPGSVDRFPEAREVLAWMAATGFTSAQAAKWTGGVVTFYTAQSDVQTSN